LREEKEQMRKQHEAALLSEKEQYQGKLQGYTEDIARFKKQYSESRVSHGRAADRDGWSDRSVRNEAVVEEAVEPCANDGGLDARGGRLDDEDAPSGLQADTP
jgi:hypothetical protein